jgi:hypothetical protein
MHTELHRELRTLTCGRQQLDMLGVGEWCRDKYTPSHKETEGSWEEDTWFAAFLY